MPEELNMNFRCGISPFAPALKPKYTAVPSTCLVPFYKMVVDPYGFIWRCCLTAQPNFQHPKFYMGKCINSLKLKTLPFRLTSECKFCPNFEFAFNTLSSPRNI